LANDVSRSFIPPYFRQCRPTTSNCPSPWFERQTKVLQAYFNNHNGRNTIVNASRFKEEEGRKNRFKKEDRKIIILTLYQKHKIQYIPNYQTEMQPKVSGEIPGTDIRVIICLKN
jgi:hypothetical protein